MTVTGTTAVDQITFGNLDVVTSNGGNDTFIFSAPTSGNTYSTIADTTAGDKLQFADQGTDTFAAAKIALADTAVFQDYLDAAATATNAALQKVNCAGIAVG